MTEEKRFSEVLKEETVSSTPSEKGVSLLRQKLKLFAANLRGKGKAKRPDERLVSKADFNQQEDDAIDETIAVLMHKYRQKLMSSRVTSKAAYAVLKQVRNWVRQRYAELNRTEYVTNIELDLFAPAVFRANAENRVEDFERLHSLGVIDVTEYYFLFAAYHGEETKYACELIKMDPATGRQILQRARKRIIAHLEEIDAGILSSPQSEKKRPEREVDHNLLMSAFRHILRRAG